jgi:hypothetical protein
MPVNRPRWTSTQGLSGTAATSSATSCSGFTADRVTHHAHCPVIVVTLIGETRRDTQGLGGLGR